MKIKYKDIAKDLRISGFFLKIYPILMTLIKRKKKPTVSYKIKKSKENKDKYYAYLKRKDGSILKVLILKGKENVDKTGVLWFHGGGYLTGFPEMISMSMVNNIKDQVTIISPSYRLSSSFSYPSQIEDAYLTLEYILSNNKKLNVNLDNLFIGGESAGGGLALSLYLYLRKNNFNIKIKGLIPLYPMINNKETNSSKNNNAPVWNEKANKHAWNLYLKDLKEIDEIAVPSLNEDFRNFPPLFTFVGTIEPFYDEVKEFVKKLKENNNIVYYKEYEGCFHAFDMMVPKSKESKDAIKFFKESFKEMNK